MDITLERILSLIPSEKDGRFKKYAAADFASKIGVAPNLPSEWKSGRNKSYKTKLQTIADAYNVSIDWLYGETDIKEKPTLNEDELDLSGISAAKRDFISAVMDLDDDQVQALSALVVKLKAGR